MREISCLRGVRPDETCGGRSVSMARIIGIIAIVLTAGSSAFGQFIIQPMKLEMEVNAGRRVKTRLALENLTRTDVHTVDLRLVDMSQDPNGIWQVIEPDAEITEDPNGARWVTVESENNPLRLDVSSLRSCQSWLRLDTDTVELEPLKRKEIGLQITVPPGKVGYYCAALVAQTRFRPGEEGVRASVILQFVVPIIIEVQGRVIRHKINLMDVDLQYRAQQDLTPAATLVSMGVENIGETYNRLICVTRIWGHLGGHWQRITEKRFLDTGIIPGVTLNLKEDVGRPLPSGKYKIQGVLYIDGRRDSFIEKIIDYSGDGRLRQTDLGTDAPLTADPREITIEALPGASRGESMTLVNASEETVIVDVEVALPDEMRHAAIVDGQGRTVRGDQMSCVEWLDVSPKQLTLRGYARRNLRVMARMPRLENPFPNYFATIRLKARYPDGKDAGVTTGQIYIETRGVEAEPRIHELQLTLGETAPERFLVTAHFANSGLSHVLPRCRGVLTTLDSIGPGMIRKRLDMSGDAYAGSGSMLPCEKRKFAGVLDISDVAPGDYRLTAILEYGLGGSAQVQKGIAIRERNGQKTIDFIGLDDRGGEIDIRL